MGSRARDSSSAYSLLSDRVDRRQGFRPLDFGECELGRRLTVTDPDRAIAADVLSRKHSQRCALGLGRGGEELIG